MKAKTYLYTLCIDESDNIRYLRNSDGRIRLYTDINLAKKYAKHFSKELNTTVHVVTYKAFTDCSIKNLKNHKEIIDDSRI